LWYGAAAKRNVCSGALLPNNILDQAVDALASDLCPAALFERHALQRSHQSSSVDVGPVLADMGASGLQQMLADMNLALEALA
jgi:hypothetical protein